jgi:hypothetical protein
MPQYKTIAEELLCEAELLFGKKINDWNFANVYVMDKGLHTLYEDNGNISICVSKKVYEDNSQLYYQLSHEVCHLLHPSMEYPSSIKHKTLVINEGVSTLFSFKVCFDKFNISIEDMIELMKKDAPNYYLAFQNVSDLLSIECDAIKLLRNLKPRIDTLKKEDFKKSGINASSKLITNLLKPFAY